MENLLVARSSTATRSATGTEVPSTRNSISKRYSPARYQSPSVTPTVPEGADSHAAAAAKPLASASQRLVCAIRATVRSPGGRRRISSPPSTTAPAAGHAGASAPRYASAEGSTRTAPLLRAIAPPPVREPGEPRRRDEPDFSCVPVRRLRDLREHVARRRPGEEPALRVEGPGGAAVRRDRSEAHPLVLYQPGEHRLAGEDRDR